MAQSNIKQKTISGVIWKFLEKFSIQLFTFLQSIVMARLLDPSDYGLIGMVVILNAFCAILVDAGMSNALIRKNDRRKEDYSTVFDYNFVMNIMMAIFMVLIAPLIAIFYHQPILKNIIYLFAVQSASGALLAVQGAKMIIDLQFKAMGIINVVTTVSSGIISIVLALSGFGVYSLVIPNIVAMYIRFGLYYYYQRWFPGFTFSMNSFRALFSYGSKILISNLINCIFDNIYPIVIGKKFSPKELGYYTRGQGYASMPATTVTDVIANVTFPILSKIQDDSEELSRVYRRVVRVSAFLVFPVMVGLFALARPAVLIMISSKWEPCIIYLQIMCFSFMWHPITTLNMNLLQVNGRSDVFLRITVIQKVFLVASLVVTVPLGILWMCVANVVITVLTLFINTYYTSKLLNLSFAKQMMDLCPSLLASIVMGIVVMISIYYITSLGFQLLIGFLAGVATYFVISKMFRFQELPYVMETAKEVVASKWKK